MKKGLTILLLIPFCILIKISTAQVDDTIFETISKKEKVLILNEHFHVSFTGQKAEYIELAFEKDIEYKILENPEELFPFELPEEQDPIYTPHGTKIKNTCRQLEDVKVERFNVTVTKPDGRSFTPVVNARQKQTQVVTERERFGQLYSYVYQVEGIEPGDVVRVRYKYSVRYIYNYFKMFSYRIFLHGVYPKKHFELTLSHHFDLEVDTFFVNMDTYRPVKNLNENILTYSWDLENLPGCLDEPGSKPYLDLPWLTITVKPYELLYQDFNSFRETFVPMWYYLSARRENFFRTAVDDANQGAKDRDNLAFEKLASRYINMGADDSSGIDMLRYFQRYMVDSVTYVDDFDYYHGDEGYLKDHPGIELAGQKVRDHLKDYVYASMLLKLGLQYFTAYIADNRSGAMGVNYYAPVYDNELLFAPILNNNTLAYLLPKSDTRNLYCEELPFYYEDAPVLLIYTYDFAGYKRNFNELIRIVHTPGSGHTDNTRKINGMVSIDLANGSANFNSKIYLSGQYSTLTRNNYTDYDSDSTVNPRYLLRAWETLDEVEMLDVHVNQTSFIFPYQSTADANYIVRNCILPKEGNHTLNIGDWTRHVIWEDFTAEGRQTDFYPDFLGSDSYAYMLEFDRGIKLQQPPAEINVDNDFGTFKYSIRQIDTKKVLINSYFLVKQPLIKSSDAQLVEEVFRAIERSESTVLEFSID